MLSREAEQRNKRLKIYFGLSVLLHLILLLAIRLTPAVPSFTPPENTVYIDLPANVPNLADQQKEIAKQIAESEVADNNQLAKDAKYLGERSQTVKEETRSKVVDTFKKGSVASRGGQGKGLSLKDLVPTNAKVLQPPTKEEIEGYREEQRKVAQQERGDGRERSPDAAEGSASNDYLRDVKDSDRTMLNTKEFVYFGYYQRIKKSLEVAWSTKLRQALGSYGVGGGGRQLASNNNYVTGLIVVLDRAGRVTAVQVLQRSGAHDLDQAAVDAFNQAGPFPDPPSGLVDENGEIKIRWDFVLQS